MSNTQRIVILFAAICGTYACVAATSDTRSDLAICTDETFGSGSGSGSCGSGCPLPASTTYSDSVEVDATAAGTAAAGKYTRGGMEMTTSAAALKAAQDHAKHYDGKTTFTATYSIVVDDKGVLDKTKSTVTFKTKTYLDRGTEQKSTFTTNAIKVTSVTLTADCPPKVKSFTFESADWYPATETGSARLIDRTLTGSMDIAGGTTKYTAKYTDKTNGAVYTYTVDGKTAAPVPPGDGSGSGSGSGMPLPALDGVEEWLSPPDPSYELADAGTACDDTLECDFPDGLSCVSGTCQ